MKIMMAAHDAGGAEILSALCLGYRHRYDWKVLAAGPAKKIFHAKEIFYVPLQKWSVPAVRKKIRQTIPDILITGTGWGSDFERNFIEAARLECVRCCAYLDGWFNFRERFGASTGWQKQLPDYVLVGDEAAYRLGLACRFPKKILRRIENPFWESVQGETASPGGKNGKPRLLYVMQPGQQTYQKWMQQLEGRANDIFLYPNCFLRALEKKKSAAMLRFRPHPSEATNRIAKYIRHLKRQGYGVEKSPKGSSILEDLRWSDAVIGLESMAMVMGLALGKKAISFLPQRRLVCRLPQAGIKKIRDGKSLCREIFKSGPGLKRDAFLKVQLRFNQRYHFPKVLNEMVHEI